MHWLTIWHRILSDFWPLDKSSVAPNLVAGVAQTALYAAVAFIFYPPLRRWFEAEVHKGEAELHSKLDHIIKHHPAIPEFKPPAPDVHDAVAHDATATPFPPPVAPPGTTVAP